MILYSGHLIQNSRLSTHVYVKKGMCNIFLKFTGVVSVIFHFVAVKWMTIVTPSFYVFSVKLCRRKGVNHQNGNRWKGGNEWWKVNAYIRGMFSRSRVSVPECLPNFLLQVQDFGECLWAPSLLNTPLVELALEFVSFEQTSDTCTCTRITSYDFDIRLLGSCINKAAL